MMFAPLSEYDSGAIVRDGIIKCMRSRIGSAQAPTLNAHLSGDDRADSNKCNSNSHNKLFMPTSRWTAGLPFYISLFMLAIAC